MLDVVVLLNEECEVALGPVLHSEENPGCGEGDGDDDDVLDMVNERGKDEYTPRPIPMANEEPEPMEPTTDKLEDIDDDGSIPL